MRGRHDPARHAARLLLALAASFPCTAALAQAWPAKPVRIVVPYTPGGYTDVMARMVGEPLGRALGATVVFENKPGANSILGVDLVAKAPPDGYTLVNVIAAFSANATLYPKLPYDVFRDFAPVSLTSLSPSMLVANNDFPARSVAELIAYARANPGKVNYGSSGTGAAAHLTMEALAGLTGTKMQHVPYKGTAPALTDLIGGQIGVMFDTPSSMLPHVRAGKVRALAVASDRRIAAAPDIPTVSESGLPGFTSGSWTMLLVPAGTPSEIVARISGEVAKITRAPAFRDKLDAMGLVPMGSTPDEAAAHLRAEVARWGRIVREAGVKPEG